MTTFTSDDREEAYKKILEEAPTHIGYEDAVDPVALDIEPIPFVGWVNTSPPHIVDSGASVMKVSELQKLTPRTLAEKVHNRELRIKYLENRIVELEMTSDAGSIADLLQHQTDYINFLEKALESSIKLNKAQTERQDK